MKRHLLRLLLASSVVALAGCAHREAQAYGAGGGAPLGIVDCYEDGDIYGAGYGPCTGIVYGDYEQYPSFTPVSRREVTLTGDRHRGTRVVSRPGFDAPSSDSGSPASSTSTMTASSSPPPPASAPRMDPAPVSAAPAPVVVSRPH